ncbi:MAG: flagellar basal body P-ring protein FlgI [Pirellulaceae bacterium]|nr:flagellar basal body P-ring protein FlgI [Pirellulaceae bacterium]
MSSTRLPSQWRAIWIFTIAASLVSVPGCSHIIKRGQSPETEAMEFAAEIDEATYIGDIATPTGMGTQKVDGIALVTQLDGTGSEPRPSGQRDYLITEIKTHNIDDINGLLESEDNSMVLVMGMIPQGAEKGDRFDINVKCLDRSKSTSLEGGYLMQARMKPFVSTRQIGVSFGHNSALVRGRVIVDALFQSETDVTNMVSGVIPGGGIVTRERTNQLRIKGAQRSIKVATDIGKVINDRFSTRIQGSPEGVANPINDQIIEMLIPEDYRHNIGRYFHVVLNIAFDETPLQQVNRLESLERRLHDPKQASLAAIRLEAIGEEAKNVLKRGIRANNETVQFHAAEALAYMGDNSGLEILRAAADEKPQYRWHALTAMASIKDAPAEEALVDLFNSNSAEARYGAFRAIRKSMPESLAIAGEFVGREFMLHTVSSSSRPIIHISSAELPEVVIFGGNQRFNERLIYVKAGITVKAMDDSQVLIKQYLPNGEEKKITCSNLISDVIRQMVKLEADYSDVIRLLKHARESQSMESQLVINAAPQLSSSYRTVEADEDWDEDGDLLVSEKASSEDETSKSKGIFR